MTRKICFWINKNFIQYGIAKLFQDNYDYELYAIVDGPQSVKDFFKNQNIVNFKKIWFFENKISASKLDYDYLKSFEKKYGINLIFVGSMEKGFLEEYNQYHKFQEDEILKIIEQECQFYESILDDIKPDFLFLTSVIGHHQYLWYKICKKIGIKPLILEQIRSGNLFTVTDQLIYETETEIKFDKNKYSKKSLQEIKNFFQTNNPNKRLDYVKKPTKKFKPSRIEKFKALVQFPFIQQSTSNFRTYGRTKKNILLKGNTKLTSLKIKKREKFVNANLSKKIDETFPFIYFPLHEEPEQILLMGAPFYSDQISVIRNIAKSLPIGYKLFVKEHPGMSVLGWRDKSYYKEILSIPHVRLLHSSVLSEDVIKKCSLVISIRGTATLEAAFHKKPSICFYSELGYQMIPSIYVLKDLKELPHAIRQSLQKTVKIEDLSDYVSWNEENGFEFLYEYYARDVALRFKYNAGYLKEYEINSKSVLSLINDFKDIFKKLGQEYSKKIKSYEN